MKKAYVLAVVFFIGGCCDQESPRMDNHFSFGECCLLEVTSAEVTGEGHRIREIASQLDACGARGKKFEAEGVTICAEALVKSFHLRFDNNSGRVVTIDVPNSRFVVTSGTSLPAYAYPLATVPPLDWNSPKRVHLGASQSDTLVFQPIQKSYWVASGCNDGV